MDTDELTRRRCVRWTAAGLAAGAGAALAGCSGPEEDGNDGDDDGGVY